MGLRTGGISNASQSRKRSYRVGQDVFLQGLTLSNANAPEAMPPGSYVNPTGSDPAQYLKFEPLDIEGIKRDNTPTQAASPPEPYKAPEFLKPSMIENEFDTDLLNDPSLLGADRDPQIAQSERDALEKIDAGEDLSNARATLQYMKDGIDIVNSYYKYHSIKADNNANILQARKALMQLESDASYARMRQQSMGESKASSSRMSAVARGQDFHGDNASTNANQEEIYALQQMAIINVNAMRQAIGLESQIIQLQASTEMARRQRNVAIANSVSSMALTGARQNIEAGLASRQRKNVAEITELKANRTKKVARVRG